MTSSLYIVARTVLLDALDALGESWSSEPGVCGLQPAECERLDAGRAVRSDAGRGAGRRFPSDARGWPMTRAYL